MSFFFIFPDTPLHFAHPNISTLGQVSGAAEMQGGKEGTKAMRMEGQGRARKSQRGAQMG